MEVHGTWKPIMAGIMPLLAIGVSTRRQFQGFSVTLSRALRPVLYNYLVLRTSK